MKVTLLNDSLSVNSGKRLTTCLLEGMPKPLIAQLNTHRMLSRNAESSRARPTASIMEQVSENPYSPVLTSNQKGMQGAIITDQEILGKAKARIEEFKDQAIALAVDLKELGIHKQNTNRYLEPFMLCSVIVSFTEIENFFNLRCAHDVQHDLSEFAHVMKALLGSYEPTPRDFLEWHFAYPNSRLNIHSEMAYSTARTASVSYANHAKERTLESLKDLHDSLVKSGHMSPLEHQAIAISRNPMVVKDNLGNGVLIVDEAYFSEQYFKSIQLLNGLYSRVSTTRNFRGWLQYRTAVEENLKLPLDVVDMALMNSESV